MKKNLTIPLFSWDKGKRKMFFMRLGLLKLMLIFGLMSTHAEVDSQTIISGLKLEEVDLSDALERVEELSSYDFVFNYNDLKGYKISVDIDETSLENCLDEVLKDVPFEYKTERDVVIISYKEAEAIEQIQQENKSVKGKVVDEKGEPLPGVSVILKGTTVGVATDINGNYSIRFDKTNTVLIFSFVGMISRQITYKGQRIQNVRLLVDSEQMEEVIVTGYQIIERRHVTSSVTSVKGSAMIEPIGNSIDKMIQGKIAGVTVINQSSTPGAAPKIRIRGASSITGNREPVWVVDGVMLTDPVPLSTEELNSMDKVNLIGNAISFINPEDIERIDVLKDASATAIYGVKAANGVIVISTKQGKKGKPRIHYSTSFNYMQRPDYDNLYRMNSKDRIEISEEMHRKGLKFTSFQPSRVGYEGSLMDLWDKKINYDGFNQQVKAFKENNTDWYDLLFSSRLSQTHNMSISGGSNKTKYYFSTGYSGNKGVSTGVDYTKYNSMLKLNMSLKKNLKLGVSLSYSSTDSKRPHSSIDLFKYAYETSRALPAYNTDGTNFLYANKESWNSSTFGQQLYDPIKFNIFDELDNTGKQRKNQRISSTFNLSWKINKMISFNTVMNISRSTSKGESWANAKSYYAQCQRGLPYGISPRSSDVNDFNIYSNKLPFGGELALSNISSNSYSVRNSLRLSKDFGKHSFSSNLGTEIRSNTYEGYSTKNFGYLPKRGKTFAEIDVDKYPSFGNVLATNRPKITDRTTNVLSYYATLSYVYNNKYILNYNVRADGSNKFGEDKANRFLPVWSVSGRWNVYQEEFLKNIDFISSFAIRASYGVQGNVSEDQVPNLILRMGGLDKYAQEYKSILDKVPNNKLKWEKTTSYNIGADFSFFNSRLSGSLELYKKEGRDQIISKEITTTNGATRVAINEGQIDNHGWEIAVRANILKTKDFNWSMSVNTGKNYNKVKSAGKSGTLSYKNYIDGTVVSDGMPLNTFYSYMYKSLDENGYPTFKNYNEKDEEGNYLIGSQKEAYARIFKSSGSRMADLTGGLSTSLRYKRFSLSSTFSFSFGSKMRLNSLYKDNGQELPFPQQNMSSDFSNRWKKSGDELFTNVPVLSDEPLLNSHSSIRKYPISSNMWEMYNNSDLRVVSGDFIRCRNVSLRYTFDNHICKKIGLKKISTSLNIGNVFVLKDSKLKGRDPEQVSLGSGSIPPQRTYSFTISTTL